MINRHEAQKLTPYLLGVLGEPPALSDKRAT